MDGILDGIRVIDLATGLAGSVAGLMLAEAGADVVKIEAPGGDRLRGSASFAVWNRSKRSIVLDIAGAGRDAFGALLAASDVLIHDLVPDQADALDLGSAALRIRAPHLIVAAISGNPSGSADQNMPVDDALVLASAGLFAEQPAVGREGPAFLRFPLGSWCAAWLAVTGVTARLLHVRRGGAPGPANTSILQGALVPTAMLWRDVERPTPTLGGRMAKTNAPSIFQCGDGVWIHLMACADGIPAMRASLDGMDPGRRAAENAKFPPHHRYPNWGSNVIAFRSRPSSEWLEELWANDIPAQPAMELGQIYDDEQARLNGYIIEVDDPDLGQVRQPGPPIEVTPPLRVKGPAPRLDADRAEILRWVGDSRPHPRGNAVSKPLDGLKVVDFGNFLAGPLGAMLLADLGADVIKVEAIGGDPMRLNEAAFLGCQRGKRALAIDIKNPESRPVVERLIRWADVVHHNLRMPAAERLGLGYDRLRAIKPDLVYVHVSGYGRKGPRRNWPGYDQLFQALSGWEVEASGPDNPPTWYRFGMMDHQCAIASLQAALLALIRRERTGEGSFVSASLLGASMLTVSETVMLANGELTSFPHLDTAQMGVSPGRRMHQCSDGWVVAVGDDVALARFAGRLTTVCVEEALNQLRAAGAVAVQAGEGCGPGFLSDLGNRETGLVAEFEHGTYGRLRQPGLFWSFTDLNLKLDRAPPTLGEHSREILDGLHFSNAEIDCLMDRGVVRAS